MIRGSNGFSLANIRLTLTRADSWTSPHLRLCVKTINASGSMRELSSLCASMQRFMES